MRTWSDEQIAEILALRDRGLSRGQIAVRLGVTRDAVCGVIWRADRRAAEARAGA